ncbi:hypothetical protein Vadar_009268 [Vaccinium darrowii]|uniref:Uncharacterized protein n=1 Tax=Vaccinium darrowii TaxID=229202 RepID=A0ACB7ZBF1_9ERIC|nr:hypothetical protein Vadar_009268 [Vaccinium darrowii]
MVTFLLLKLHHIFPSKAPAKPQRRSSGCFGPLLASISSNASRAPPEGEEEVVVVRGVQHVGGDMFESVPKGDVIFMKWILHEWSDELCLKLLKNCWNALPESGKVIIVESILSENPQDNDPISRIGFTVDMITWTMNPRGKERTEKEFEALAKAAGFAAWKPICRAASNWVIEFYKKL